MFSLIWMNIYTQERITLPQISDDLYKYLEEITNIHPEITEAMLVPILKSNPDSNVEVFSTKIITFASWTKNAVFFYTICQIVYNELAFAHT